MGKSSRRFVAEYAQPLPISLIPLPVIIPHNPASLIHCAYAYIMGWLYRTMPPSVIGVWDERREVVQVHDKQSMRLLWTHGFFGKGTFSRSEPTFERRAARELGLTRFGLTNEEITEQRRKERLQFKRERQKREKEAIERQRALENGTELLTSDKETLVDENRDCSLELQKEVGLKVEADTHEESKPKHKLEPQTEHQPKPEHKPETQAEPQTQPDIPNSLSSQKNESKILDEISNIENLELSIYEAIFLSSLGVLEIKIPNQSQPLDALELLHLNPQKLAHYAVYHYFRSLGWCVRSGPKFAVDFLLYRRGPVFSHSEFAIKVIEVDERLSWDEIFKINRVCTQVKKTLVLVYIWVPALNSEWSLKQVLKKCTINEVCLKRWSPNRQRG